MKNIKEKITCLNCGYQQYNDKIYNDDLGTFAICQKCKSSFEVGLDDIKDTYSVIITYEGLNEYRARISEFEDIAMLGNTRKQALENLTLEVRRIFNEWSK